LFFGLALFGALGFAAAFGFFVGTFVAFLTLEGDFLGAAGEARFFFSADFTAAFFGALAFFTLAARGFFTVVQMKHDHELARQAPQVFQSSQLPN